MKSITVSLGHPEASKSFPEKVEKKIEEELANNPATNAVRVIDIYLPLNHLFNQAAKKAFQNKVKDTVVERSLKVISSTQVKVVDQVRYFGAKAVGDRKIFDAAQKVANQINEYANKGYVTGVLGTPLLLMPLATEPHELEKYFILSYVSLSPTGLEHLDKNPTKLEFEMGGVPNDCDDL